MLPNESELSSFYNAYPDYPKLSALTIKRYQELLDKFEKFRKSNRILDVGCGHGHFLEEAKIRGWEVYGTEYTEKAKSICQSKGIEMHLGDIDTDAFPGVNFDVITSIEVVEHVGMIKGHMELYPKKLRSGGALYITTPNFNSLSRFIMKQKWRVITIPEHLSYFNSGTLSACLSKTGLHVDSIKTTGLSISEIKYYLLRKNNSLRVNQTAIEPGSENYILREQIESNTLASILKNITNKILSLLRLGDTIKIQATKIN